VKPRIFLLLLLFNGIIKQKATPKEKEKKVTKRREWVPYVHQVVSETTWEEKSLDLTECGINKRTASSYRSSQMIIQRFILFLPLLLCLRLISCSHLSGIVRHTFREKSVAYTRYADRQIPAGNSPIFLFSGKESKAYFFFFHFRM
jgi:hypothetical protein